MSATVPQGSSMGSLRRTVDPLDRMGVRGGGGAGEEDRRKDGSSQGVDRRDGEREERRGGDRAREERVAAMDKTERRPVAAPTSVPV